MTLINQAGAGQQRINGKIVEVNVDGSWGSLCDDTFAMEEANLVCKHAGYHLGAKEVNIEMFLRGTKFQQSS